MDINNNNQIDLEFLTCEKSIGNFIGLSDMKNKCWKFSIYLGDGNLCILYERGKGIYKELFDKLLGIKSIITQKDLVDMFKDDAKYLGNFGESNEFNIYEINLFVTPDKNKIKLIDLIKVIEHNLKNIDILEEGDIIAFERSFYSHHAILTDVVRMIVTHRYGEPEDGATPRVASASLLGCITEKAVVSEDNLIDVAGYRKIRKSNEPYDRLNMPRSKEEIVREAKKRIGEKGYSLTFSNCQHFASECRNGKAISPEIRDVIFGAGMTIVLATSAVIGALISKYFLNNRQKEEPRNKSIDKNSPSSA